MKYKLAIFDMDGTILNTLDDLADSMNHCLRVYGLAERSLQEIRMFLGNGIHWLVECSVPDGTDAETLEKVYQTFLVYYKDHCAMKTRPYEGIPEVLQSLRRAGVLTAVVSNKADYAVKILCEDYFKGMLDFSVGELEGRRRKPYPDSVNAVLERFGMAKEDAVYIGDSEVDFQTAQNAGLDVIMVGWGFRDEDFLKEQGAESVIHEPAEILKLIGVETEDAR
ncbi:MAG: HAD-IA family hydrolase [Clostridiales bacterium]|nr:HAD-IA family hydrolase [Clostridiales bacterium]